MVLVFLFLIASCQYNSTVGWDAVSGIVDDNIFIFNFCFMSYFVDWIWSIYFVIFFFIRCAYTTHLDQDEMHNFYIDKRKNLLLTPFIFNCQSSCRFPITELIFCLKKFVHFFKFSNFHKGMSFLYVQLQDLAKVNNFYNLL